MKKFIILSFLAALCTSASFGARRYRGDLNGDRKIDLADMSYLAKAINAATADSSCDLNVSGKVDATDLHILADIILSEKLTEESGFNVGIGGWDDDDTDYGGIVGAPRRSTRSGGQTMFYISDAKVDEATGKRSAEIGVTSTSGEVCGILFNVLLPQELEFDSEKMIILDGELIDGHLLYGTPLIKEVDNGKILRFIVFSSDLTPLKAVAGSLGRIHYDVKEA
ncbi:MAG: hypothetical protein K2H46_07065, partial [Muribaculaceae bacterium]|nr:hypothetical protein [Muribaculaceae bacterium]